ncbi:patatin-like phospholipase family protein [Alloscardovia macacae]|uniref:Patatin family protein n=1 Tax=Alloscardovia macacae TaxID=1160091 RepID=A0A261F255_9BIFI|nr:patatin family protein [Alloscardovia macacae]OZG53202.1 patatin family protein [Alloscardovia macacae]
MITGIIDVGGGYRDIFGAGVLDGILELQQQELQRQEPEHQAPHSQQPQPEQQHPATTALHFTHAYGISAGSGNLTSFLAGQHKRNYRFYMEYAFRHRYASMRNMLRTRNFVGLDYAYGTLSNSDGEYPLNYEAFAASPTTLTVVASDASTGLPHYFAKQDMHQDDYTVIMASSCVPVVNRPVVINGVPYFDGGLTDPIPVQKAFDDGCEKVVLITTHPADFVRDPHKDTAPARALQRSYPYAAEALRRRAQTYNDEMAVARRYAADGRLLILAPDETYGLNTLSKTRQGLLDMYNDGVRKAQLVSQFFREEADHAE